MTDTIHIWVEYPIGTTPREWPAAWIHVQGSRFTLDNFPDVPPDTPDDEKPRIRVLYEMDVAPGEPDAQEGTTTIWWH